MPIMRNTIHKPTLTALVANTETAIPWKESDERMILIISAGSATTLTVKAGNGIQGSENLVLTVQQGVSLVKLESGFYKNVTGTNKGKIVVVSPGTPSVGTAAMV